MTLQNTNQILPSGVAQPAEPEELKEDQSVQISINPEVLLALEKERLSIDQLFILIALHQERIGLLDIYDKKNENKKVLKLEYQDLYIHGFLQETETNQLYELSDRGKEFVEFITGFFEKPEEGDSNIKPLCEEFLQIFPKIKLPSGSYARVSIVEIEKKMKNFIKVFKPVFKKEYGFVLTHDDILQATRTYVSRYASKGYMFMQNSAYFIQKKDKSSLADEILAIKTNTPGEVLDKFTKVL